MPRTKRRGADSAPSPSLWGWTAFRDFGADHREKRLRRCEVGFGGDQAFACLLKESEKLSVRFRGKIAFGHFDHGFLLSVLRRPRWAALRRRRSEEHTSELQSLMRISYAVFCLQKKKQLSKQC